MHVHEQVLGTRYSNGASLRFLCAMDTSIHPQYLFDGSDLVGIVSRPCLAAVSFGPKGFGGMLDHPWTKPPQHRPGLIIGAIDRLSPVTIAAAASQSQHCGGERDL